MLHKCNPIRNGAGNAAFVFREVYGWSGREAHPVQRQELARLCSWEALTPVLKTDKVPCTVLCDFFFQRVRLFPIYAICVLPVRGYMPFTMSSKLNF